MFRRGEKVGYLRDEINIVWTFKRHLVFGESDSGEGARKLRNIRTQLNEIWINGGANGTQLPEALQLLALIRSLQLASNGDSSVKEICHLSKVVFLESTRRKSWSTHTNASWCQGRFVPGNCVLVGGYAGQFKDSLNTSTINTSGALEVNED